MAAASVAAVLLLGWIASMGIVAAMRFTAERDRAALAAREAEVTTAEHSVSAYRDNLHRITADLAKRQDFIERMVDAHIGELPDEVAAETDTVEVAETGDRESKAVEKISTAIPEAGPLLKIEAGQLAFVARLTRYADRRSAEAETAIRKLGLNPRAMLASATRATAEGGPYVRLATSQDGSLDSRFERLGVSLARMDALERSLASIPQVEPASMKFISSGFGYRSDPFTGRAAFHAGLDFRGPTGAPIFAAAKGVVSFAGVRQGYGKVVEIRHASGLTTRYAHMSRIASRAGDKIEAGQVIGAIGSTGRSTGPHLHFEVRVHGKPVNPMPFLKARPHVHKKNGAGE